MSTGIGSRIRERRKELGLSQEELATRVGLKSKSTICKIEKGEDNLTSPIVEKYAKALYVSPAELMGWDDLYGHDNPDDFQIVYKQEDYLPTEILVDSKANEQFKEFVSLFVKASPSEREYFLRILRGLVQES